MELDALTGQLNFATIYFTSDQDFTGESIELVLGENIGVKDVWPRWPEDISEKSARWVANAYPRYLGSKKVYSFGIRLGLIGYYKPPVRVEEWRIDRGAIKLRALTPISTRLFIGPFIDDVKPRLWRGRLEEEYRGNVIYLVIETSEQGEIHLEIPAPLQPLVAGFFEHKAPLEVLPVIPRISRKSVFHSYLIMRLPDLECY